MQAVFMVQWADSETKTGERKKKAVSFTLSKNGRSGNTGPMPCKNCDRSSY